jgi:DHA1 family multidrug resistance protein-like MFS transporter
MADLLREAPFGQLIRLLTGNKFFKYPEEKPDFICPSSYKDGSQLPLEKIAEKENSAAEMSKDATPNDSPELNKIPTQQEEVDLEKAETRSTTSSSGGSTGFNRTATLGLQRTQTVPFTADRLAIEQALAVEKTKSRPILPARTADNTILADWYIPCLFCTIELPLTDKGSQLTILLTLKTGRKRRKPS